MTDEQHDYDFGPQWISPHFTREKISPGVFVDWVDVWEDRFRGWWLAHAHSLRGQPDGVFLMVHIAVGLIEALEVAYQGKDSEGQSAKFFCDGFCRMFTAAKDAHVPPKDAASVLYKAVRCGLSHTALLKGPVYIVDDDRIPPLQINATPDGKIVDSVILNPIKFLDVITMQFNRYVKALRDGQGPEADALRKRFEEGWHTLHARELPQPAIARK